MQTFKYTNHQDAYNKAAIELQHFKNNHPFEVEDEDEDGFDLVIHRLKYTRFKLHSTQENTGRVKSIRMRFWRCKMKVGAGKVGAYCAKTICLSCGFESAINIAHSCVCRHCGGKLALKSNVEKSELERLRAKQQKIRNEQ
jgi:hypothetical protein